MRNRLRRLAEFIQEGFPEKIEAAFKYDEDRTLEDQLAITSDAIAYHQDRADKLWLKAGRKRTAEERYATAQAALASFVFAYLIGEAKEHADSTIEAMRTIGRQSEVDIVVSLTRDR